MQNETLFAALDLGSNTCRLIFKKFHENNFKFIDSLSQTVRLAEGLHEHRNLSPQAIERALEVLRKCANKIQHYNPTYFRAVATEACRIAHNADKFLETIRHELQINIEVISPTEEAYLSLRGCEQLLDSRKPFAIVFDIGGASTEIMLVEIEKKKQRIRIHNTLSLPYGVVRVSETYGKYIQDVFPDIRQQVCDKISQHFNGKKLKSLARAHKLQLLGCSGTATTIAAIALKLKFYDRRLVDGARISLSAIHDLSRYIRAHPDLLSLFHKERYNPIGRRDLIEPGLAILQGICQVCAFPSLHVADRGVRDGIITDLAQSNGIIPTFVTQYEYSSLARQEKMTA